MTSSKATLLVPATTCTSMLMFQDFYREAATGTGLASAKIKWKTGENT
jgi:hypothetical protein